MTDDNIIPLATGIFYGREAPEYELGVLVMNRDL